MKKDNLLPFPTGDLEKRKPINNHLIERSVSFSKEVPHLLNDKVLLIREYFLTEVLPLFVGLESGMDDSRDIIKLTFDEEVEESQAMSFESMLRDGIIEALAIKTIYFITNYVGLNKEQAVLFMMSYMTKTLKGADHGRIAEALLREMQQVLDLQRSSKVKPKALVREVPKAEGNPRRKRVDGTKPGNTTRGKRKPAAKKTTRNSTKGIGNNSSGRTR